jgi:hypothetical protein
LKHTGFGAVLLRYAQRVETMAVTAKVRMAKVWIMGVAEMITPALALAG